MPGAGELLMAHRYPKPDDSLDDPEAEAQLGRTIEAVQELRGWRDRVKAAAGRPIPARLDATGYEATAGHIARLARLEWTGGDGSEPVATVAIPGGSVAVFASDAVDLEAEARRIQARTKELEAEIGRAEGKLANERFVAKAPEAVVQAERDKLARLRAELDELR
jgi:valyl-tRNA synthetase